MKKEVVSAAFAFTLLASSVFTTMVQAQDVISGKWSGSVASPAGPSEMSITLKASADGILTGSISSDKETSILDGKVNGKEVSFRIPMEMPDMPAEKLEQFGHMFVRFTGKIDGDSMTLAGTPESDRSGVTMTFNMPPIVVRRVAAKK